MGVSRKPLLVSFDRSMVVQKQDDDQEMGKSGAAMRKQRVRLLRRRPKRVLMKRRRGLLEGSRRTSSSSGGGIQRRVNTLKKLVPRCNASMGLDGVFRETADYILSLQTRVRFMQTMVKALTGSDDN